MKWLRRQLLTSSAFCSLIFAANALADESIVVLKNRMILGPAALGSVAGVDQAAFNPNVVNSNVAVKPVVVLDDNLRLTFFNNALRQSVSNRPEPLTVIQTGNAILRTGGGRRVAAVQNTFGVTPFDDFGRRIYSLATPDGPVDILQGITEISANHLRVEGLAGERSVVWDMRIAPNTVPPDKLRVIILNHIDQNNPQAWLDAVSVYWQAKRFREARDLLQTAIKKFPELEASKSKQLASLDEQNADLMFREVKTRFNAGQYKLAKSLLDGFDRKRISVATEVSIGNEISKFETQEKQIEAIRTKLAQLVDSVSNRELQASLKPLVQEIQEEISISNLNRFADFNLQQDSSDERRLAIGASNWLMGSGSPVNTLPLAVSLVEARNLLAEYLASQDSDRRSAIVASLKSKESGTASYLSRLAQIMQPPLGLTGDSSTPGRFEVDFTVAAIPGAPAIRYTIQLPPEYDPNRKYPCVLTLHGEFSSPQEQIDWWSGTYNEEFNQCLGEASRHGYITVAPHWGEPKQPFYNYTENEHAKILGALRDAMRRSSIDTDRVFLSGHYMGGDAAWDIALAHPDLWAGMVAVGADCERFPIAYYKNAKYVPTYFVIGELDGAPAPLARNGKYLDRLLKSPDFDTMLVIYKGRGRDHFQEELPRIMEWMNLSGHRRDFAVKSFEVSTARPGDNFFWFLELRDMNPSIVINPHLYSIKSQISVADATVLPAGTNGLRVGSFPSDGYTLWLSPDFVNLDEKITIIDRGKTRLLTPVIDISVLLEDIRQRADRQHPFWMRADF